MYPHDPATFHLDCLPGCSLVNPLIYKRLQSQPEQIPEVFIKPTVIDGDCYHIVTDGFWIAVEEARSELDWKSPDMPDLLGRLVQWMRYVSKQFFLTPRIASYHWRGYEVDRLPEPSLPMKGDGICTSRYALTISLTHEDLRLVSQCDLAKLPPTYDTMLLGAMQALQDANYGWAIVLSGVAIEHIARAKLLLETQRRPGVLDEHNLKYARLKDLLHSLRLRLSLRSLCCEAPTLYRTALDIYGKRSDILHGNLASDDQDWNTLRLSAKAVQCAIDIVEWFGEPSNYESPFSGKMAFVDGALYP